LNNFASKLYSLFLQGEKILLMDAYFLAFAFSNWWLVYISSHSWYFILLEYLLYVGFWFVVVV